MAAQGEVNNKPNKVGADSLASALPHATAATLTNNRAISRPVNNPGGARGDGVPARGGLLCAGRCGAAFSPSCSPGFSLSFFGSLAGDKVILGREMGSTRGRLGAQNRRMVWVGKDL